MDNLQYIGKIVNGYKIDKDDLSFKPYYKWITFNTV